MKMWSMKIKTNEVIRNWSFWKLRLYPTLPAMRIYASIRNQLDASTRSPPKYAIDGNVNYCDGGLPIILQRRQNWVRVTVIFLPSPSSILEPELCLLLLDLRTRNQNGQNTSSHLPQAATSNPIFIRCAIVISGIRNTSLSSKAIQHQCSQSRDPPHYPAACDSPTARIPHFYKETLAHAHVVCIARACLVHRAALRLRMARGRSSRESAGRGGQELEESQWRRHGRRVQQRAAGYPQDPGGEYEWRQDHGSWQRASKGRQHAGYHR